MISRARRAAAEIPFHRLVGIALVLAATLPTAVLGMLVYARVDESLAVDAVARTGRAADAAAAELARASRELDELVRSYATWDTFVDEVNAGDLDEIRLGVLEFLVERGTVAGGVVRGPSGVTTAGPEPLAEVLREIVGPVAIGSQPSRPRVESVAGMLYLVGDATVGGTSGAGRLALARPLDARLAADIATFTGFSVALLADDGRVAVTTDAGLTDAVLASSSESSGAVRTGDVIGWRTSLDPAGGGGELVLATRVSAMQAASAVLPPLVFALVAFTVVLAALLAVVLSTALGRRLAVVHDGLIAVADGRIPPATTGSAKTDDIARLSAGLDRLVRTLDRREATLRRCLEAAAAVPLTVGAGEAANRLAAATVDIFGVGWCRIVAADGTLLGASVADRPGRPAMVWRGPAAPAPWEAADPPPVGASMGPGTDDRLLEVGPLQGVAWTDGDEALLEVMAVLAGGVLDEVTALGEAMGRADRLDRLNRMQREFMRSISHNLRAPLATIELAATDLEEFDDPFVQQRAEAIRAEEQRLARLVNQILVLSRMEAGTLDLVGEPVALRPLVARVARELGIVDRVTVDDRGAGTVAFADPAAVEQIAWVLLDNAARYAPNGRIVVEIVPDRPEPDPTVILAVEDEGPGIAPDERRRIFQRFVRGRSGEGTDGTGLGLSVARGLARTLGGEISCRPGAIGARFEVRLPSDGGPGTVEPRPGSSEPASSPDRGGAPAAGMREAPAGG